ncbi:hypothetical protein [Paenibacillus sp. MBLB4367]
MPLLVKGIKPAIFYIPSMLLVISICLMAGVLLAEARRSKGASWA